MATHLARRLHRLSMKKSETVTRWRSEVWGRQAEHGQHHGTVDDGAGTTISVEGGAEGSRQLC